MSKTNTTSDAKTAGTTATPGNTSKPTTEQAARPAAAGSHVLGFTLAPQGSARVDPDALEGIPEMPSPPSGTSESITRYHLRGVLNLQMYPSQLETMGQAAADALCHAFTDQLLGVTVQTDEAVYDLVCVPVLAVVGTPPWGMQDYHLWPPAAAVLQEWESNTPAKTGAAKARQTRKAGKRPADRGE